MNSTLEKQAVPDIRFRCPHCKGKLVVEMAAAGHHANCPHCSRRVLIPPKSEPMPPPAKTASGIVEGSAVSAGLTTTQKIEDGRKLTTTTAPAPPKKTEPLITQKIADGLATPAPRAVAAPYSAPAALTPDDRPGTRLHSINAQKMAPGAETEGTQARQLLTSLIDGLKKENEELKKKLAAASPAPVAPAVPASGEIDAMRKSIAERDAKIGALESAGERLRSEIGAAAKKHDESQSALDALRSKLEASQSAAEAQQKTINEERQSLTQLTDGLKRENEELKKKLAAPPPAPVAPAAPSSGEIDAMRKIIAERDAKIGALESAGERLRSEIGAAAKKHDESQSALDALRSKLEASQSAAEAQQKSINEERRSLTQLIDGLKLENAELVNRLAAMPPPAPPEYESAKREMTALRKDLAERETRLSTTESMLAQLRVELAAAERTRTESDESLRIIRHDLETARAAVLEQQQQADAAIRREEQLVAEMSVLRDASAKTAATAAGLAEELAASRIQAETNLAASEAARLDLATAREQLDQLRTESDQIARQRDTLAADIDLARQSLQARSEKEAILVRDLAGARDEAARLAKRENHLGDLLQAAERSRDEMASGLRESEAKAAEAAAHAISQAEIDAVRSQLDESRVECAKLNEKFTHLAAENQKLTSQLADADSTASKLRADLAALQDQSAIAAHALEEAESEIERLRTDWNRLLAERKELVGRVSRSNEEAERLISEKSALLMAFSEMEDRAKNLESERGVGQELRQRIAATTEENTFLREQLEAVSNVSADIENSRKKIAELEDDNRSLREQMRRMEHESLAKEASTGASLGEAKLRRRIEELETTLRTAESVTHTLKNRLRTQESDQQRRQNSDTVAGIEPSPEIASELGIRLRTSEQAARKLQAERDAAIRTQEELENTLQAVNEQARELHAKLDAATNAAGTSARQSAMGANAGGVGSGRPISTSSLIMIIASVAVFVAILWLCGILDLSMLGLPSAQHVSPPVHR